MPFSSSPVASSSPVPAAGTSLYHRPMRSTICCACLRDEMLKLDCLRYWPLNFLKRTIEILGSPHFSVLRSISSYRNITVAHAPRVRNSFRSSRRTSRPSSS